MARQLMGEKKTRRIAKQTGLDVLFVLVRGGTNHRKDLLLRGGTVVSLHKDGRLEQTDIRHNRG